MANSEAICFFLTCPVEKITDDDGRDDEPMNRILDSSCVVYSLSYWLKPPKMLINTIIVVVKTHSKAIPSILVNPPPKKTRFAESFSKNTVLAVAIKPFIHFKQDVHDTFPCLIAVALVWKEHQTNGFSLALERLG